TVPGYAQRCPAGPGGGRIGGRALRITPLGGEGSQSGEPAEQSGGLVPFGQGVRGDLGVGGLVVFAFGLGGGASVDLGGGQVHMSEDVADVGQWHACLAEVHGEGYLYLILKSAW